MLKLVRTMLHQTHYPLIETTAKEGLREGSVSSLTSTLKAISQNAGLAKTLATVKVL